MKHLTFCGGCMWTFHDQGFGFMGGKEMIGAMKKQMFCYGCNKLVRANKWVEISPEEFAKGKKRAVKVALKEQK